MPLPSSPPLLYVIYFIYFFCGLTMCFEGVFLPEFKEFFHLNYQQQMYTMFAKNIPFLLAFAIGYSVKRIGYKNCLTTAMTLFAAGTLLLVPGLRRGEYSIVLLGFFLIGIGFNFQLVAGNPLLCALGPARDSSSRLNLGNALGAVAQILAPASLTLALPAAVATVEQKQPYMQGLFLFLGGGLFLLSLTTLLVRSVDITVTLQSTPVSAGSIWRHPNVIFGFVAIFLVLGVEAGFFGFYRNYVEDPAIAGLSSHQSQQGFTVFLAVFALGRLAGSWIQKRIHPAAHLLFNLPAAALCLLGVIFLKGAPAVAAFTLLGFFVSIFFPTLYSIAIAGMGSLTGQASGLLTMGFVGCALLPVLQGKLADTFSLPRSFSLGLAAYLIAFLFALRAWRRP